MQIRRFPNNPIIRPHMDDRMGDNINGPSLIRVPSWIQNPLGKYYLYFAHHKGAYIRLAYANSLEGPWKIHSPGVLDHQSTQFGDHIASPDCHVLNDKKEIRMYYHGGFGKNVTPQLESIAHSTDGLHFTSTKETIGTFYWRVFQWKGFSYGLCMHDQILRSKDGLYPFEPGPNLGLGKARHSALLLRGNILHIFFTRMEDCPESILHTTVELSDNWMNWQAGPIEKILEPEMDYEGFKEPLKPSSRGPIYGPVRQLRDPGIFEEDGRVYLLYGVAGEQGIAMAEITGL